MRTKEVIELEKNNVSEIHLYLEGLFWRAYEHSAFMFCTQVKELKVVTRRVKSLGNYVVCYVGFPTTSFDSLCKDVEVKDHSDKEITLKAIKNISDDDYELWKKGLDNNIDITMPQHQSDIVSMIKGFNVAEHTPIECMTFIVKIQGLI